MSQFHPGAALAGLAFAVAGALFLLDEAGAIALPPGVVAPALLVALGLAAIVGSLASRDRA